MTVEDPTVEERLTRRGIPVDRQGFAGPGFSVTPVVTYFCVEQGERGWFMLAGLMVGIALVTLPAARWALASRERYGVTTHSG